MIGTTEKESLKTYLKTREMEKYETYKVNKQQWKSLSKLNSKIQGMSLEIKWQTQNKMTNLEINEETQEETIRKNIKLKNHTNEINKLKDVSPRKKKNEEHDWKKKNEEHDNWNTNENSHDIAKQVIQQLQKI